MSQIFPVLNSVAKRAWIDEAGYFRLYEQSLEDPNAFWGEQGKRLDWIKPYTKVKNTSFTGDVSIKLVRGRHAQRLPTTASTAISPTRADQTAILWEGDSPHEHRHVSYAELHEKSAASPTC